MATLKFRHLILYFICFTLLYFSDFPGGALISIASWLQVCVLLWGFTYNLRTQAKVFIYFLTLIPIYFLLGSSSAFSQIYIKENSHLYFLLSCVLTYSLSLLAIIFSVLSFKLSSIENGITDLYAKVFHADRVETKELCVGQTCLNEAQVQQILRAVGSQPVTGSDTPSSDTPVTDPVTMPQDTSTPPTDQPTGDVTPQPSVDPVADTPPVDPSPVPAVDTGTDSSL